MLDYLCHWIIRIFKEDNEILPTVMLVSLFLLGIKFIIVQKYVTNDIQC